MTASKTTNLSKRTARLTVTAMFTALIIAGGAISVPIPISPSPVSMTSMFVLLAGLVLGWKYGMVSVALYILLGAAGQPVFSGFTGGFGVLASLRGGFILSFLPAAALVGLVTKRRGNNFWVTLAAVTVGTLLIIVSGVTWARFHPLGMPSWSAAIGAMALPFLPGDALKIVIIMLLSKTLLPRLSAAEHFGA